MNNWQWEPDVVDDVYSQPGGIVSAANPAIQRILCRSGLLDRAWRYRLSGAPEAIRQFIRRFCTIFGFEHLVKGFFGNLWQKRASLLGMQLIQRLSGRLPNLSARLVITQEIGHIPQGGVCLMAQMELDGKFILLLPWNELNPQTIRRQFSSHQTLFGDPSAFRWVLSGRLLGMNKDEIVNQLESLLSGQERDDEVDGRGYFDRLVILLP